MPGFFQELLSQKDSLEKFERLRNLAGDFAYAAETYGRIIPIAKHLVQGQFRLSQPPLNAFQGRNRLAQRNRLPVVSKLQRNLLRKAGLRVVADAADRARDHRGTWSYVRQGRVPGALVRHEPGRYRHWQHDEHKAWPEAQHARGNARHWKQADHRDRREPQRQHREDGRMEGGGHDGDRHEPDRR